MVCCLLRINDGMIELSVNSVKIDFKESIICILSVEVNFWKKDILLYKELEGDIGYIYFVFLERGEINDIMKKFMDKKGIVVDFCCYFFDFIVFSFGGLFMF